MKQESKLVPSQESLKGNAYGHFNSSNPYAEVKENMGELNQCPQSSVPIVKPYLKQTSRMNNMVDGLLQGFDMSINMKAQAV